MRESTLREMLADTPMSYSFARGGMEFCVFIKPDWDFVVKVPMENPKRDISFRLRGYRHSMRHLKDCIPKTSIIENPHMKILKGEELQPLLPDFVIVQERKLLFPDFLYNIDDHLVPPDKMGQRLAMIDITIQQRGCFRMETDLYDYGVGTPTYGLSLVDLGTIVRGESPRDNMSRFVPVVRGHEIYRRYWQLRENAPASLVQAYVKTSKLPFEDINPSPHVAFDYNLGPVNQRDNYAQMQVLCRIFEKEFTNIALAERKKYYKRGGVGEQAEPFITPE